MSKDGDGCEVVVVVADRRRRHRIVPSAVIAARRWQPIPFTTAPARTHLHSHPDSTESPVNTKQTVQSTLFK